MTPRIALPRVTVAGSPEQLGNGLGDAFQHTIALFVPMRFAAAREYFAEHGRGSVDMLHDVGRRCYEMFGEWDPIGLREHNAVAEAAGVDPVELFTAANYTDVRDAVMLEAAQPTPHEEGCSAALIGGQHTTDGQLLVGQTWDLNPQDLAYVVAVHRLPDEGPETWSITVAGAPSLVGMNQHGITVGTTNIKTWGSRVGVGYMNILHKALRQTTFEAAGDVILSAPRSGAHTYWVADPQRARLWETTPDQAAVRDVELGPVYQTNHCQARSIRRHEWLDASASSQARLARMALALPDGGHDLDSLKALFADRSDGIHSLNRYPEDAQGTATNSVVLARPAARELWACRGPADRGIWHHLEFERGEEAV